MGLISYLYSVPSCDPKPTHVSVREVSDSETVNSPAEVRETAGT